MPTTCALRAQGISQVHECLPGARELLPWTGSLPGPQGYCAGARAYQLLAS